MRKENIKIFVAYHKPPIFVESDNIIPIQVWKATSNVNLWIIWDNTWDNISNKNKDYAELTAQYRIWKNYDLSNVDYVWFCHYRRYITYKYTPNILNAIKVMYKEKKSRINFFIMLFVHLKWICYTDSTNNIKIIEENFLEIKKYINNRNNNIFLMKPSYIRRSLKHLWINNMKIRKIFSDSLLSQYPEYKKTLSQLDFQYKYHFGNMFIMDKKTFKWYAEWLFNVLFKFEKWLEKEWLYKDLLKESIVESWFRPYGYISEFMLNLYVLHNKNLKVSKDFNVTFFW